MPSGPAFNNVRAVGRGPVLLNARAAARAELGGVERWARELSRRLPALEPSRYRVVRPPPALAHRAGHAWEQLALPARAARSPLLLNPANLAPLAFPRNVVVIHDAAALREPSWYSRLYVTWQRALLPALARRAVHLVTVSQFSRRELIDLLGADPGRITVIPGGVDDRFRPDADPEPARVALGLERPYVLTVASRTARKNLAVLGETARRLAAEGVDLLAAGGDRPQFRAEGGSVGSGRRASVGRGGGRAGVGRRGRGVRFLGPVPDEHLPGLYAGARAFVLPSLYEGFGLTALEAMACGVPVVVADRGGLPEVVGDVGRLVDPEDPGAIARAVVDAASSAPDRIAAVERARRFSWERTAREVDALVARLLA
ncbi:MAG TPA: glycosyltransferase family 1 protein [Solirubrobacteraceae bacterium]|nr:glycosyltransferase family 1 protein [Solirubrobacteraceae bacterium]